MSQITIDYTDCDSQPSQTLTDPSQLTFTDVNHFSYNLRSKDANLKPQNNPQWAFVQNQTAGDNRTTTNTCFIRFDLPADLEHSVFLYYKLTNFFQNHRRYVKSLDTDQLRGKNVSFGTLHKGDCAPVATIGDKSIYPCGLIANSLFNGMPRLLHIVTDTDRLSRYLCYHDTFESLKWRAEPNLQLY